MATNLSLRKSVDEIILSEILNMYREVFSTHPDLLNQFGYNHDKELTRLMIEASPISDELAGYFEHRNAIVVATRVADETFSIGGWSAYKVQSIDVMVLPLAEKPVAAKRFADVCQLVFNANIPSMTKNTGVSFQPLRSVGRVEVAGAENIKRRFRTVRLLARIVTPLMQAKLPATTTEYNVKFKIESIS